MSDRVKPPVSYFGSKSRIAHKIAALLPPHESYVEPFAGSLAVLLAKPPSKLEIVNDLDGDLVAFWRILRERPADLERACALTPHSRLERARAHDSADSELEQARRVWVRLTQGRGGHTHRQTGWRYYSDPQGTHLSGPAYLAAYVSRIPPAAERLIKVSLECRPALEVVADYGQHRGTLIFADPPYLGTVRQAPKGHGYGHEMLTDDDHRELAAALRACKATVVLCGYPPPLYGELYGSWHAHEIRTATGNAARDRGRTEVLWFNRPFPAVQQTFEEALAVTT